jgi:ribosomal protein S6--L-glutamate ligase
VVKKRPIWLLSDRRYLKQRMPSALRRWLERQGWTVELVAVDDGECVSALAPFEPVPAGSPLDGLEAGDLVVCRTRDPFGLAVLAQAEARGARSYDSSTAVDAVRDKVRSTLALAQSGVRVPETFVFRRPEDLGRLPERLFPLLLKPRDGDNANGIRLVAHPAELGALSWPEPVAVAQRYIDVGQVELKVYVADDEIWAIRRPSPLTRANGLVTRIPVTPALEEIAYACQGIFGLRLLGIDVLESSDGPLVVDVNEFPNYTAIEEAPAVIGALVAAEAEAALVSAGTAP